MAVSFYDAFDITPEGKTMELFKEAVVEKITASRSTNKVNVYIFSSKIISIKNIHMMEDILASKVFKDNASVVKIYDRYEVADKYDAEKIYRIYADDINLIMREAGNMVYSVYSDSQIKVQDGKIIAEFEDSFFGREISKKIMEIMTDIFSKRFDYSLAWETTFVERIKEEKDDREDYAVAMNRYRKSLEEQSAMAGGEVPFDEDGAKNTQNVADEAAHKEEAGDLTQKAAKDTNKDAGKADSKEEKKAPKKTSFEEYKRTHKKLPDDPNIFYGRPFEGDSIPIVDIQDEIGDVVVVGKIFKFDFRVIKNGKTIVIISITDFTDSINVKMFLRNEDFAEKKDKFKEGNFIQLKGIAQYDTYDKEVSIGSVVGIKTIGSFVKERMDDSEEKRVELHCHTKMSDMDGVSEAKSIVARAEKWGHSAIAITDHGVVQAFPDAEHALSKGSDLKIIFGLEAYLVDDVKEIVTNSKGQGLEDTFVVFDIETIGFGPVNDQIIEIGAVKICGGEIVDKFSQFINPQIPIPYEIEKLTSINDSMVAEAPLIEEVLPKFLEFCEGAVLVAHNASFDVGFITKKAELMGISTDFTVADTVAMARTLLSDIKNYKLDVVAKELNISLENHHRAVDDALCTAYIFLEFMKMYKEKGIYGLDDINSSAAMSDDVIKKMPTYHAIILAKNDIGRVNLYKLVSLSHLNYYARRPRIPKSLFTQNREGLLIGSACEAGELYQAILRNQSDAEIIRLVNFYDYLEIQPLGNNKFMLESPKFDVNSEEDLIEINKKIIKLGKEYNKPVVATCDVHFLDPADEVYRRIIMTGNGFKDADDQAPLYYRTTKEMLDEFAYLGSELAKEVVITNTNKIANMIDKISSVRPDKAPPVIENSDEDLRNICYTKARQIYGDDIPAPVKERLDHELNSIIGNGFAVMYIIAQKLVWKSNDDGYLVGSRGSVGSSFAATMSGITEVNPLPAHYYCAKCHYNDFDSEEVKAFSGKSGVDMPDKNCPVCGEPLCKEGHDIPFETFLGFYGDKEPDIDLNFSGEYQSNAHAYTEVIFGKGQTFRAGTITGVAEKTAYGYVNGYFNDKGINKRRCEKERIAKGCEGVKKSTGQHPGGIVVLPLGEDIYSFTPLQRPANDVTTSTVTTHFDYHKIDHNLLKLDILGHDDPTMIRMLEDITGIDAKTIRLDDEKVLSLFVGTDALNLKNGPLWECDLGSLGVPEFGTDFVMQMLRDTKPQNFSELVRISGLSHGTDVWLNNAQYYIAKGDCTISTAICTRDDIMTYLIYTGVENGLAFKIMESVRKGKGLTEDMKVAMRAANVPEWYIESCLKIKYMFPKAHAVAYVMMAFRIAYFKVYYPLAYYAAYFSIRAKAFNYEVMCQGKDILEGHMRDYLKRKQEGATRPELKPSKKDEDMYSDMKIVHEMYARGFEFMPIDIFRAKAHHFQIIDGKLMPSFDSIEGLGDKAADSVVEGVAAGPFLSREDFKVRCKTSSTVTETMAKLGLLGDLPESNQMSLTDFFEM